MEEDFSLSAMVASYELGHISSSPIHLHYKGLDISQSDSFILQSSGVERELAAGSSIWKAYLSEDPVDDRDEVSKPYSFSCLVMGKLISSIILSLQISSTKFSYLPDTVAFFSISVRPFD